MDEKTYESPFNHAINPEAHGANTLDQAYLVNSSVQKFVVDGFEAGTDLRGAKFEVLVHADGLFCTIRRHER